MTKFLRLSDIAAIFGFAGCITACAYEPQEHVMTSKAAIHWTSSTKRVIVDLGGVQVYERSEASPNAALGFSVFSARDDWGQTARGFMLRAVADELSKKGVEYIQGGIGDISGPCSDKSVFSATGNICADYVLQITAADWHRDAASKVLQGAVGIWTLGLVPLYSACCVESGSPLANQLARAEQSPSMVLTDVRTHEVVWSRKLPKSIGDLRTESAAKRTVDELFRSAPI